MKSKKDMLLHCSTEVNSAAIRHEMIDSVDHIIIRSYTLPDDIIMNNCLFPGSEISNSFHTLERTLAPVGHPVNSKGDYIPSTDPVALHKFHVGAFNINVLREGNRVRLDKAINVNIARKTELGKRLLDRIDKLESGDNSEPIHTSVSVMFNCERHEKKQVNAAGKKFTMTARNMIFEHDAILLDEKGAATPKDGVGMAVNKESEDVQVIYGSIVYNVEKSSKIQLKEENKNMKDLIVEVLNASNVDINGCDDNALLEKYNIVLQKSNEHASNKESMDIGAFKEETAHKFKDMKVLLASLEDKLKKNNESELEVLAQQVFSSKSLPTLELDDIKKLGVQTLKSVLYKEMPSYGLNASLSNGHDKESMRTELPD